MRKFFPIIAIVALIALGFLIYSQRDTPPAISTQDSGEERSSESPVENVAQSSVTPAIPAKEEAWNVLSLYLDFAGKRDLEGLRKYAYQLSDSCLKEELRDECNARMDSVTRVGALLKNEDYNIVWSDQKQMILTRESEVLEDKDTLTVSRGKIIFARRSDGALALLYFNPEETWIMQKNPASTTAETKLRLDAFSRDSDEDGITDEFEMCIFPETIIAVGCEETNPQKRDTDGDGWWDGVEIYFREA